MEEETRNGYTIPSEMKKVWKVELEILCELDRACKELGIKYFLDSGTLLGAARDGHFIPWDDDIDVEMPRADYNKLMELLSQQNNLISENIELKTPFSKNYQYPFAKVIDNTTFVQEVTMKEKYKTSVWIDIFPLDNIPDSPREAEAFLKKAKKMSKYYFYTIERKYSGQDLVGIIKFNTIRLFLTPIYTIINQKQRINHFAQRYSSQNTKHFTELIANNYAEFSIRDNSFLAQTKLQFENRMYTTFADYDTFLKNYYGDYMKLPPEEQRVLAHSLTAYKK